MSLKSAFALSWPRSRKCLVLWLTPVLATAQTPLVQHPDQQQAVAVSPGVLLKELTGRTAQPSARSERISVAWFHLEPGRASALSRTKTGEETFLVLNGHGEMRAGNSTHPLRPGSFIVIPPGMVRSIKASATEALEFYAITSPAWRSEDDVLVLSAESSAK